MENDNFKLEPYQNTPHDNLRKLRTKLAEVTDSTCVVVIWTPLVEACNIVNEMWHTLNWNKIEDVIMRIELAKFKAAEFRNDTIFDIVACEWLAWEIMADVMTVGPGEKSDSPIGDISWKTDYQESKPESAKCACGEPLTIREEIERGVCMYCAYGYDKPGGA